MMKKKRFSTQSLVVMALTIVLLVALLMNVPSQAAEIRYPVPSYEGEALAKVREWEKEWVGKRITHANIDQVKEFFPEAYYNIIKDYERWGETWFEIVPYREIKPSKGDIEYTTKYAGSCKVGPDEKILNHISGIPFPNPNTPLEIVYNFDNLNLGDNISLDQDLFIADGKREYDRKIWVYSEFLYFSARREIPPKPEYPPNKKGIYRAAHSEYIQPASLKGNRGMQIKWGDRSRDYGSWFWSSATRRIVRRSSAQRQDHVGGSDLCLDDNLVYDGSVGLLNYKLLGRKDILLARHQALEQYKEGHTEGNCIINGTQRERLNTYVIEAIHKDPNYIYSKQFWYVDPETWYILYADKYDRMGKLWKIFDNPGYVKISTYNNEAIGTVLGNLIIDVQRLHATGGASDMIIGRTGKYHEPDYYTPKALQKYGY